MPDNPRECTTHSRPAVVVYFIGGVTYGEVATMRYLSKVLSMDYYIQGGKLLSRQLI